MCFVDLENATGVKGTRAICFFALSYVQPENDLGSVKRSWKALLWRETSGIPSQSAKWMDGWKI